MLVKIGDLVQHKTTKITGKVIGYGEREIAPGDYMTTLQVELQSYEPIRPIAEDLIGKWKIRSNYRIRACSLPHFPKYKLSKAS